MLGKQHSEEMMDDSADSSARRLAEWVLLSNAVEAARAELDAAPRGRSEFVARARTTFEVAELAWSRTRGEGAPALSLSAELYRQAAYWALRATVSDVEAASPADVWRMVPAEVVREAAADDVERAKIAERLVAATDSFIELSGAPEQELRTIASALRAFATASLSIAERPERALERAQFWRTVRMLLVGGIVSALAFLVVERATRKPNLASHATWRVSSKWAECFPDIPECGGTPTHVFFHTNEEREPWFEYDFGRPTRFSSLEVKNRRDCCRSRAVPLVAEVSDDRQQYREVARTDEEFVKWNPRFEPQVARYLRLRVRRESTLHLEAVRVFP